MASINNYKTCPNCKNTFLINYFENHYIICIKNSHYKKFKDLKENIVNKNKNDINNQLEKKKRKNNSKS